MKPVPAIRRRFEGIGCLGVIALVLAVIGVLALLLELQSPTAVLWTGSPVAAQDVGGVVLYPFGGHNYTLVLPNESAATPAHTVTVFVDPNNPSSALEDSSATRWFDAAFVGAPFVAALLLIAIALVRNTTRLRARSARGSAGGFGQGFDPDELRGPRPSRDPRDDQPNHSA
jgi:hypothetical protein